MLPADPSDLPLPERLAQLLVVRLGSDIPPVRTADDDAPRVADLLAACTVGGLLVFNGRHATTPHTLASLQSVSRVPLLVMADVERGYGQQLRPWPLLPHAMAFERLGADAATAVRTFGELTARAARRAGVHAINAPVADVHSDPANPIIATRAFSQDPVRAGELVAAFIAGCAAGGGLAVAKHFPGHGDTREDSHDALPVVAASRECLLGRELVPFRAAVAAGVPMVMTAHVRFPALDAKSAPATLSRPILDQLLRHDLGFTGAVVSDSLLMAGVRGEAADEAALCARALAAGVDLLLDVERPAEAVRGLLQAVTDGRLCTRRVDEACSRVLALKRRAFAGDLKPGAPPLDEPALHEATLRLANRVATAAVQIDDPRGLVPLDPGRSLVAVLVNHYRSHIDPPESPLATALRSAVETVDFRELRGDEPESTWRTLTDRCLAAEQVLVAIVVKPAAWHRFGLPPAAEGWLSDLIGRRPVVVACLGAPGALDRLPEAAATVTALSDVPASQSAVIRAVTIGTRS